MKVAALFMAALAAAQSLVVESRVGVEDAIIVNENSYPVSIVLKNNHPSSARISKVVESWRQPGKSYRKTEANRTVHNAMLDIPAFGEHKFEIVRQQALPVRSYDLLFDVHYDVDGVEHTAASTEETFKVRDPEMSFTNPVVLSALFFVVTFVGIVAYLVLGVLEHPLVFKPVKKERQATPKREESPSTSEDWIPQRHLRSRTRAAQQ